MKNRLLKILLAVVFCLISFAGLSACGGRKETIYQINSDEKTCTITGWSGTVGKEFYIPEEFGGLPVTRIGEEAFKGFDFEKVIIPDSVMTISEGAFTGCNSLKEINIPDSVITIDSEAFQDCNSLESVVIGDGVKSIGAYAFYACSNLTSVVIGKNVWDIGEKAFFCIKLVEVINNSFYIKATKGDTYNGHLGYYAIAVYNRNDTFMGSKLSRDNGYVVYTDGEEKILVNYMGEETDLTLPAYLTKIHNDAFYFCKDLTRVVISDGVKSIGDSAFSYCFGLQSVVIPKTVTKIEESAFASCDSLTSFEFGGTVQQWYQIQKDSTWKYKTPATEITCSNGVAVL